MLLNTDLHGHVSMANKETNFDSPLRFPLWLFFYGKYEATWEYQNNLEMNIVKQMVEGNDLNISIKSGFMLQVEQKTLPNVAFLKNVFLILARIEIKIIFKIFGNIKLSSFYSSPSIGISNVFYLNMKKFSS